MYRLSVIILFCDLLFVSRSISSPTFRQITSIPPLTEFATASRLRTILSTPYSKDSPAWIAYELSKVATDKEYVEDSLKKTILRLMEGIALFPPNHQVSILKEAAKRGSVDFININKIPESQLITELGKVCPKEANSKEAILERIKTIKKLLAITSTLDFNKVQEDVNKILIEYSGKVQKLLDKYYCPTIETGIRKEVKRIIDEKGNYFGFSHGQIEYSVRKDIVSSIWHDSDLLPELEYIDAKFFPKVKQGIVYAIWLNLTDFDRSYFESLQHCE